MGQAFCASLERWVKVRGGGYILFVDEAPLCLGIIDAVLIGMLA